MVDIDSVQPLAIQRTDPSQKLTEVENHVALWVAEYFAVDHYKDVLELIHKHDDLINDSLWYSIIWQLTHADERPEPITLAIWTPVLLKRVPVYAHRQHSLEYLLTKCKWPEDRYAILRFITYLLEPIPVSEPSFANLFDQSEEYKYEYRLTLRGDDYWLPEVWAKVRNHVGGFWRELLPSVEKYLIEAYNTNVRFKKSIGDEDSQSVWRSAIEEHEQDRNNRRSFDTLIDAARDILLHMLSAEELQEEGRLRVESWFSTEVPLLRRIAIYSKGKSRCWTPSEKIEWLLDRDLIYKHWYKHEVFGVIKAALADCDKSTEDRLVKRAMEHGPMPNESEEVKPIREYERYNLLNWMQQAAPDSSSIRIAFEKVQSENHNFLPREHPDLDMWTSGAELIKPESPYDIADLRLMPLRELAELVVSYEAEDQDDYHDKRRGLLEQMSVLATSSFEWSMRLAHELVNLQDQKGDAWRHLIEGWKKTQLSEEEWKSVIEFLSEHIEINRETDASCELLETAVKETKDISESLLSALETLGDLIWKEIEQLPPLEKQSTNWLATSINHGAGRLGEFWLQALHRRFQLSGANWSGIPDDYIARFETVIASESFAGQLVRCILMSRLHYVYMLSQEWSKQNLLPLLVFSKDALRATQAWHGYLTWGRTPLPLLDELKPLYVQAIDQLIDTEDRLREQLFLHVIGIMLEDDIDPPDLPWLHTVINCSGASAEDKRRMLDKIWHALRKLDESAKQGLWSRWFQQFWSDRLDNIPVPLTSPEADRLIECAIWLEPVLTEAVDLACRTNDFSLEHTHLYSDLRDSELPESHPDDVLRLLIHVLEGSGDSTLHGYELKPLYDRLKSSLKIDEVKELTNLLKKLGVI